MKRVNSLVAAVLFFCCVPGLSGQESQDPAWVLFEKGKTEMAKQGELGVALRYFRQALDKRAPFPEAEEAIGDIHRLEGNFLMAEIQYQKAYKLRNSFQVPVEQYQVLQKLAEIYKTQEKYKQMEDALLTILKDQPYFADSSYKRFSDALYSTYREKGIDHFLKLYRVENITFAAKAHEELSWFYYRTGRYVQAIRHGLFGINIFISESVPEIRKSEPEFEFTTLRAFIDIALSRSNLREYLTGENFFSMLYYLAAASYAAQLTARAEVIWEYLAETPAALRFQELSRRQLRSPWVESYLNTSSRKIEYPAQ
jgi:tetratricopeptide (TPR) repeat protein